MTVSCLPMHMPGLVRADGLLFRAIQWLNHRVTVSLGPALLV